MACCTMQPEDGALPRGDAEGDGEVYHKNEDESSIGGNLVGGFGGMVTFFKKCLMAQAHVCCIIVNCVRYNSHRQIMIFYLHL